MSWKECQSTKFIYVNHFFPFLHRETLFKCYSKWTMQCNASVEISWFFHHILRETNFVDCGSAKSAILNTLEALNFDFFALFWRMKLAKLTNSGPPKLLKRLVLELLDSPKLISRKIWMTEKSWISTMIKKRNLILGLGQINVNFDRNLKKKHLSKMEVI